MTIDISLVMTVVLIIIALLIFRKNLSPAPEDVCLALTYDLIEEDKDSAEVNNKNRVCINTKGKILGGVLFLGTMQSLIYFESKKLAILILVISFLLIFTLRFFKARKEHAFNQQLEYHLPLLMERLVMTIEAGQDVISGLKLITMADSEQNSSGALLTKLFAKVIRLTEQGMTFTQGLRDVSRETSVVSVKHAMIHLALAYEQGGELIQPLRELSDATQLQYQEVVEERIAKLPIKATLPLLLLFAGLILLFVTPPILAVLLLTRGVNI